MLRAHLVCHPSLTLGWPLEQLCGIPGVLRIPVRAHWVEKQVFFESHARGVWPIACRSREGVFGHSEREPSCPARRESQGFSTDSNSGAECGCEVGPIHSGSPGVKGNGDDVLCEGQSKVHRNCPKYQVQRGSAMNQGQSLKQRVCVWSRLRLG